MHKIFIDALLFLMLRYKDRLPPANSLIVFEAVARHQSFTKAATELMVTQAAVSRQIRVAEDALGVKLFNRQHRKIELTQRGMSLFNSISMGFEHIARACDEMRVDKSSADITISSSVTFASSWLMSRIARFRAEFPNIDISLVVSAKVHDLGTTGLDFAIRYGRGTWPNARADFMFSNDIFPVCSPDYYKEHGPMDEASDLYNTTLLKLSRFDRNWIRWNNWFEAFGLEDRADTKTLRYDNYLLLMQAAIRGEGVALSGRRLAEDMIQNNELVRPIDASLQSEFAFYLLRPMLDNMPPTKTLFREWILAEASTAPT